MNSCLNIVQQTPKICPKRLLFNISNYSKASRQPSCSFYNASRTNVTWNYERKVVRPFRPITLLRRNVFADSRLLAENETDIKCENNERENANDVEERTGLISDIEVVDSSLVKNKDDDADKLKLPIYDLAPDTRADEFHKLPLKCHSCGSFMQTENSDLPGYILPKKLPDLLKNTFDEFICSHCFNLRYKNEKMIKTVNHDKVMQQLHHLPYTKALVLYVVDVNDLSGTLYPDLLDVIGQKKRFIIVGNKIDMLAQDDKPRKQEANIMNVLRKECVTRGMEDANVKDVCLVSGKTGHGIEKLVVLINKYREANMDLYIVGTTNTGKSAIYNMLQNLSCISKENNVTIPVQAVSHHFPATTLGLVRHPLSFWRMRKVRNMLLEKPLKKEKVDEDEPNLELMEEMADRIKSKKNKVETPEEKQLVATKEKNLFELVDSPGEEKEKYWMYDTPGLVNREQITHFLTQSELKFLKHKLWIVPKTFVLSPGDALLIGGLARLDYCGANLTDNPEAMPRWQPIRRPSQSDPSVDDEIPKASQSIYCTLFCSNNLTLHPTRIEKAPALLEKHFGDHVLKVPFGDAERKALFPALQPKSYKITGTGWDASCADVSLAGLGWIAFTAGKFSEISVELHTPNGIGQSLRKDCLMPFSEKKRGKRGVRYIGNLCKKIYQCTRAANPQLISSFDNQNEITKAWLTKIDEQKRFQRFQKREERRKLLLEQGIVGKMRKLAAEVDFIEGEAAKALLESGEE